jgi:hypothetical protein
VLLNVLYSLNSEISDQPSSPDEIAVSHMLLIPECHVMMESPLKLKVESSCGRVRSIPTTHTFIMAAGESSSRATQTGSKRQKAPLPTSSDSDPDSGSETDSSEDVTEDEDGVDLTPALDAAILRTLAKIRNKNGVYEGENVLANELKEAEEKVIKAGIKAMPNRKEEIKVCPRLSCTCALER